MAELTRREFLKVGAGLAVGLGSELLLPGCGPDLGIRLPLPLGSPSTSRSSVAAILGGDLYAMTREALDAVGGAGAVVKQGETVFIKPNLVTAGAADHNPFTTGECTKPEIVITVAEECLKAGAAEVIIGDAAQVARFDWQQVTTLDGSTNMAAAAEQLNSRYAGTVTLACLNADSPEWDQLPCPGTSLETIYVSSLVARADRVISIPVLKTHRTTKLTLSLKNLLGVTPLERYDVGVGYRVGLHLATGGVEQCLLNIVRGLQPDLAIIDGSIGCEGFGPFVGEGQGRTVDMRDRLGQWLLLASTDLVAADATAAQIISHDPGDVPHLRMAYEQGLGQVRKDMIDLVGARLDGLYVDWDPART